MAAGLVLAAEREWPSCYPHGVTRKELEAGLVPLLALLPEEVVSVYVFGSFARGTQTPHSDVDLAFWRRTPSAPVLKEQPYGLAAQLERTLGREVDLVELNHAPPDLLHEVLRDGVIVLDREPDLRVRFEVAARAQYLDMLPVLRRHRRGRAAQ